MMQNSFELMLIHFAASRLGAVILNLNTNLTAEELVWQLDTASCSVLICDDIFKNTVNNALSCTEAKSMADPVQVAPAQLIINASFSGQCSPLNYMPAKQSLSISFFLAGIFLLHV